MNSETAVLGAVLGVGAMVYVFVAVYVWRHRRAVGARALTVLLLAACVWTLCYLVELNVESRAAVTFWGSLKYVGIVLLPPSLLSFALQYSGRRAALGRATVALLLIEPVLVLGALAHPATRDLVRSLPASAPAGEPLVADSGPLFWVHLVYSYLMLVTGLGLLTNALLKVSRRYAWQAWLLIGSAVLPFVINAGYNLGLPALRSYDLTPLGFSITGFVLVWGFFRFRLLDLLPVGRRLVVDRLPDAVLVLDAHGRVADSNPAASALVGLATHEMVGRPLLELLPSLTTLAEGGVGTVTGSCRMVSQRAGEGVDLSVTLSPLPDDVATPSGRLVVLRDVTAQRDVERRLRELVEERTDTIAILQRGLYPTGMPVIPGVDVAAVLDPAEAETNVGGDFVAVRASGPGRWSLMVGDVVGKGAGAATLTAVARHTTLALSSLGWAPSRVLADVSTAIALEDDGSDLPRFCTMALATLEPEPGGARVVLSLGGHPRPLLRRACGDVTEVGVPGNLLGVLPDPDLYDSPLQLGPGDALVMFSDGVTEARAHDEDFGDRKLAELVSTLRGASAAETVAAVVDAVREFRAGGPRDDVAVLAIVIPAGDS
ncbi:MAG TPA: histidine kinase N-terminal 7TM domain-containing protein [Actinomycetales bacterium]|jgi:PAS domain S-box-containing protein